MNRQNDDLQSYVAQIEAGESPETVLAGLPHDDHELASWVTIAAALRQLPDPEVDPADARAQDRKVLTTIRLWAPRAAPDPSLNGSRPMSGHPLQRLSRPVIGRRLGLASGLAAVLALFIAFFIVVRPDAPGASSVDQARRIDVAGVVEVADRDGAIWRPARRGDTLREGQQIRTGPDSTATLAYFDGTRTRLAAETELTLIMVDGRGNSLRVELDQRQGRTRHDVVPLQGGEALYLVRAVGGTAIVQGTIFDVRVSEGRQAEFDVTEGQVAVMAAGQEVVVGPGQMTIVDVNAPPAAPSVAKRARPSLSFLPDEVATSGCAGPFALTGMLVNTASDPEDEALDVLLGFNVIKGEEYIESVALNPAGWSAIDAGSSEPFIIGVNMSAAWDSAPAGAEAKVRIFVADEGNRPEHHVTRLTATIVRLCGGTPTPTTTMTPITTGTPTGTPAGTATVTPTPTMTPVVSPTGTATADCTGADPHPRATTLADRYGVSYAEIMGWFCAGHGFGEIMIAYELSDASGVAVAAIFSMRTSGMGWGQIGRELGTSPGGGPPEGVGPPEDRGRPEGPGRPEGSRKPDRADPPGGVGRGNGSGRPGKGGGGPP